MFFNLILLVDDLVGVKWHWDSVSIGVGLETIFKDVERIHPLSDTFLQDYRILRGHFSAGHDSIVINDDLLKVVDGMSIDIDGDWHILTLNVESVSSLIDDKEFFMFMWVYPNIVKILFGQPIVLFE